MSSFIQQYEHLKADPLMIDAASSERNLRVITPYSVSLLCIEAATMSIAVNKLSWPLGFHDLPIFPRMHQN